MLDWSMLELAKASGVSVSTVKRFEAGQTQVVSDRIHASIQAAFEQEGISFISDEVAGLGVHLRRDDSPHPLP